jgi:hypothetical protein
MSLSLDTIRSRCNSVLKFSNLTQFSQSDRDVCIMNALSRYSRERPFTEVQSYTGTSGAFYDVPTYWEEGFSEIAEIEYPVLTTPKTVLDPRYYEVVKNPTGYKIRFDYENPGDGNVFYIRYSKRYTFNTNGEAAIPAHDEDAIVYLSVSMMCHTLANYFASKSNPSLPEAEVVGFTTRVDEYTKKADDFNAKYEKVLYRFQSGCWGSIDFLNNMHWDRNDD